MTLPRANWLAQLMRKWGFSAIVSRNHQRNCWEIFAYGNERSGIVNNYEQAVNFGG